MTTYSYQLVLDDSERVALDAALELLFERCEKELANGPCAPYWAWRENAKSIQEKLSRNMQQTSGTRVDSETGEQTLWIGPFPGDDNQRGT